MVQGADSIEMLVRKNCASILLAYESAKSTAINKPNSVLESGGLNCLPSSNRPYRCKDCDMKFATFQALGGHRASHMKLRLSNQGSNATVGTRDGGVGGFAVAPLPSRFKIHECKQCQDRFPTGQALGGHMRKHAELNAKRKRVEVEDENAPDAEKNNYSKTVTVFNGAKKPTRLVLELDLNFPPPEDDKS